MKVIDTMVGLSVVIVVLLLVVLSVSLFREGVHAESRDVRVLVWAASGFTLVAAGVATFVAGSLIL